MSIENAKAFYYKMTSDITFRTQLEQAVSKEERKQILQAAGYEFTPADWEAAKVQFKQAFEQLSNAQLQTIDGGVRSPALEIVLPLPIDIEDLFS